MDPLPGTATELGPLNVLNPGWPGFEEGKALWAWSPSSYGTIPAGPPSAETGPGRLNPVTGAS